MSSGSPFGSRANWLHPLPAKMTVGTQASLRWSLLDLALAPGGMGKLQLPGSLGKDTGSTAGTRRGLFFPAAWVSRMRDQDRHILGRNYFFLGQKNSFVERKGDTAPSEPQRFFNRLRTSWNPLEY